MTQKKKNEMMESATNDFKTANSNMFENIKEKMGIMNKDRESQQRNENS